MANTWLRKKEISDFKLGKENCKELLHTNDSLYASVLWHSDSGKSISLDEIGENYYVNHFSDGAAVFWGKSRKHLVFEFLKQLKSLDPFYQYFVEQLPSFVNIDFVSKEGNAVVIEEGNEEIWNLPIEKKTLLFISDSIDDLKFDLLTFEDVLNVLAAEMAFIIIKNIYKDIHMLKENSIISYNYYINSLSLGKSIVNKKGKSGRFLYVNYAKACLLG